MKTGHAGPTHVMLSASEASAFECEKADSSAPPQNDVRWFSAVHEVFSKELTKSTKNLALRTLNSYQLKILMSGRVKSV
jgi:hypothetical protein